ncbi:MAG: drug/metabolite exporter YedA [Dokdonella sp.]
MSDSIPTTEPLLPAEAERRLLVPLALLSVYVIWGSTYFAIRVALQGFPPFLLGAVRFTVAGVLLYAWLRWRGMASPSRLQWRNAAITGSLLLGVGNGLVCYAEQHVASGLAAVAVAGMPPFAALFAGIYGNWPQRLEWLGLAIGLVGVVVLNTGGGMTGSMAGAIALIVASISWAFGSVWSSRQDMPPAAMNTAAQMLVAGVVLSGVGLLNGEHIDAMPNSASLWAMLYLAVMGSLVGFTAYVYLLKTVRPTVASSYAYVNPPVAVLIGVALGGELIHALDLVSMAIILVGVGLITLGRQRR